MLHFLTICLLCAVTICASAQQCFVYPSSLTVPASDACNGVWSRMRPTSVPTDPGRSYVPPVGSHISFVVSETDKCDIPPNQADATLIISAPVGWEFWSSDEFPAYMYCRADGDVIPAKDFAVTVNSNEIILTFSTDPNCNELDDIYVCNVMAKPMTGSIAEAGATREMLRLASRPGTAVLEGLNEEGASFGTLVIEPGSIWDAGRIGFVRAPRNLTACDEFSAALTIFDCAGNISTVNLPPSMPVVFTYGPTPANAVVDTIIDIGTDHQNGFAVLEGRHIRTAGKYYLRGTVLGFPVAFTRGFLVEACAPDHLTWIQQPVGGVLMGDPLLRQPVLQLRDAWENPVAVAGSSVTLALDASGTVDPHDPGAQAVGELSVFLDSDAFARFDGLSVTSLSAGPFIFNASSSAVAGSWKSAPFYTGLPGPIDLIALSGERRNGFVQLEWCTLSENKSMIFEIQRSSIADPQWVTVGAIPAAGYSTAMRCYAYVDGLTPDMAGADLLYRVILIHADGSCIYSSMVALPSEATFLATAVEVVPTIVHNAGVVRLTLPSEANVSIALYDVSGRTINVLASSAQLAAGLHVLPFNTGGVSPGSYYIRVRTGKEDLVKRILVY